MNRLVTVLALVAILGRGEVLDKSPAGFLVKNTATIAAPAERVYGALAQVGSWWQQDHTWSGDARNLSLDPKAGGCFCEKLKNGSVQHMTVIYAAAGEKLRLSGALGPLQEAGVIGTLTFDLAKSGDATLVTVTYSAGGYYQGGLEKLAGPVDQVLAAQLAGLKKFVEGR